MRMKIMCGFALIGISLFIIQCTGSKTIPLEVSGRWTTTDVAYKGEYIEISSNALILGSESKGSFTYRIKKVEPEKGPIHNTTLYRITCKDDAGDENIFSFIFSPDDGGTLRYKSSQDTLWKKS